MSTDGITPYNSGPLIFYPAQTVLLDALDHPIPPHTALTTASALYPTTAPLLSSLTASTLQSQSLQALTLQSACYATQSQQAQQASLTCVTAPSLRGATAHLTSAQFASSATVSSLHIQGDISFSLYLGSTITTDYLYLGQSLQGASTSLLRATDLSAATYQTPALQTALYSTATLQATSLQTTSAALSALQAPTATVTALQSQLVQASSLQGAALLTQTLEVASTLYASTTSVSSLIYTQLTPALPPALWAQNIQVSTLSTLLSAYTGALIFSSILVSTAQTSTVQATQTTATNTQTSQFTASTAIVSTCTVPTATLAALQASTLTASTLQATTLQASTIRLSTLQASQPSQVTQLLAQTFQTSTLQVAALTAPFEGSTLTTSTLQVSSLTLSTLQAPTLATTTTNATSAQTTFLQASQLSAATLAVNALTAQTLPQSLTTSTALVQSLQTSTLNAATLQLASTTQFSQAPPQTALSFLIASQPISTSQVTAIAASTTASYVTAVRTTATAGVSSLVMATAPTNAANEIALNAPALGANSVSLPALVIPAGSIGISTAPPLRGLLVNGAVSTAQLTLTATSTASTAPILSLLNDSNPLFLSLDTLQNTAGPLRLLATDGLTITTPLAVGICQPLPQQTLDLVGPMQVQSLTAWSPRAAAGLTASGTTLLSIRPVGFGLLTGTLRPLLLQARGGSVGIGSLVPQQLLDVAGGARFTALQTSSVCATSFLYPSTAFVNSPWQTINPSTILPTAPLVQITGTLTSSAYQNLPTATTTQQGTVSLSPTLSNTPQVSVALPYFSAPITGLNGNVYTYTPLASLNITPSNGYLTVSLAGYYQVTLTPAPSDTATLLSPRDAYTVTAPLTVILLVMQGEPIWVESLYGRVGGSIAVQMLWTF